jgi:HAD superfamily phosphatase (TIGR01668 family)
MWRLVVPDCRVETVLELDVPRLGGMNLDTLLLDVDCTLKDYRGDELAPGVADWVDGLRAAAIGLCLVSNGRARRIQRLAEKLALPVISQACKPLPFGCWAALRRMGADRRRTAMVGDQLFADVMAGRLAGLTCILVRPIHPEHEPWFTRVKRPLERILLKGQPFRRLALNTFPK